MPNYSPTITREKPSLFQNRACTVGFSNGFFLFFVLILSGNQENVRRLDGQKCANVWKFDRKEVDIKIDLNQKEWFCGKDLCEVLGFEDQKTTLARQVKQVFKTHLKSLQMDEDLSSNPLSYHSGKAE